MRKTWILGAFVLILGLSATLHLYFISDGTGPLLFWNVDKAYLFIQGGRLGYRVSYLKYPLVVAEQYLGGVPEPDASNDYVVIAEITPVTLHRSVFENTGFSLIGSGPMGQFIYGGSDSGPVKWTGNSFEPTTTEELQKLRRINFPFNYDNLNGWSARGHLPDGKTVIELAGKQVTLVRSGLGYKETSIDLVRPGQSPERIWHAEVRAHRVSKAEYYNTFGKR